MNRQFFCMLLFMSLSTISTTILSMRSATFSVPFKNANNRFASTTQNNQPIPQALVQIPIESSNQSLKNVITEQQEKQNGSNNSKWYKSTWKYLSGLGAGAATGITAQTIHSQTSNDTETDPEEILQLQQINLKLQERYTKSIDTKTAAPELHALFLKIKHDLGITENIELRLDKIDDLAATTADATYLPQYNCILINSNYFNWDSFQIIRVLVHELEHVKQIHHYTESYKLSSLKEYLASKIKGKESETGAHLKAETGADASSAGYFDCPECLKEIAKNLEKNPNPLLNYNSQELQSGHFTTELGYFAAKDYNPYIERACLEGELCEGHKILGKPKTIKYMQQHDSMKYDPHYAQQYDQDYLNQKFNALREQKQSELPVELFLPKSS